ncbi:MAG: hypothetical protein IIU28_06310 [Lachnospiraceae bacterium]|nr:hypothetical protein [Lachnospiraceae bacterium]MCR4732996.1 hypothetical protein [Lachnospiraceae bacterium]MEE3356078.1 hypothetical protein [Candidatus Weimeria sp.]
MKDFNFMLIIDLVIAGLGIYLSYAAIIMKTRSALPPAFVASEELKRCKDPEGFATYMWSRTALFAVISILSGVLSFLCDLKVLPLSKVNASFLSISLLVLFLVIWMFFNASMRSGKSRFFTPDTTL